MEKAVDRAGAPTGGWVYIGRFRLGERCRQRGVQKACRVKTVTIEVRSCSFIVSVSGLGIFQTARLWACLQKLSREIN